MPDQMVTVRISKLTGCPANSDETDNIMFEIFNKDNVPNCDEVTSSNDIFN